MGSWNSLALEITYQVLGWIAFAAWSFSFYPQVILNYKRKSVVGLNFDFLVLNVTKHSSYLIYNAAMFFSPLIQRQYHEKYGEGEMIPVAANDVAFSTHAVALTVFTLYQVLIYDRGNQRVSKTCLGITAAVLLSTTICLIIALPNHSWLWLISVFNIIQVIMTAIKYIPQAYMNFCRKSTVGWSIGNILLDLTGGLLNFGQMGIQSIDQATLVNFYGNIGKTLLSVEVVVFDVLFIFQHYVLYPVKNNEGRPFMIFCTLFGVLMAAGFIPIENYKWRNLIIHGFTKEIVHLFRKKGTTGKRKISTESKPKSALNSLELKTDSIFI